MILIALMELVLLELVLYALHVERPDPKSNPLRQIHHGYVAALALIPQPTLLAIVWLVIALDDLIQHLIQLLWNPAYQSPLHRVGLWVYNHAPKWLQPMLQKLWP